MKPCHICGQQRCTEHVQSVRTNDFCSLCKIRPSELICSCEQPWTKICENCKVLHLSKGAQSFHSLLSVKYQSGIRTLADFQRFYTKETEANEVLNWLHGNVSKIQEAESDLKNYVSTVVDSLMIWQTKWLEQFHKVKELLTKDLEEVRGRIETDCFNGAEVDKLNILKERRPALFSFQVIDMDLGRVLDACVRLSVCSPVSMQELGTPVLASPDLSLPSTLITPMKSIISSCQDLVKILSPENPVKELDLPQDSVQAWAQQAEWVNGQTVQRVCTSLEGLEATCNLILGKQASKHSGTILDKLKSIHSSVSTGVSLCKELPRSMRARAHDEEQKLALSNLSKTNFSLSSRLSDLETQLARHKDCDGLRESIGKLEREIDSLEGKKTKAELTLRDSLEQYCRSIIEQHRTKQKSIFVLLDREFSTLNGAAGHCFNAQKESLESSVLKRLESLRESLSKSADLRAISTSVAEGRSLLSKLLNRFLSHTYENDTWERIGRMQKTAVEKMRTESAGQIAVFMNRVLDDAFAKMQGVMREMDARLESYIQSLAKLLESSNLASIESYANKVRANLKTKQRPDLELIITCRNNFYLELNAVLGRFSSDFHSSVLDMTKTRTHCGEAFEKMCPGVVSAQISALEQACGNGLVQASASIDTILRTGLAPVELALAEANLHLETSLQTISKEVTTAQTLLIDSQKQINSACETEQNLSLDRFRGKMAEELSIEVPDFPAEVRIVPLPLQQQVEMIEELQTNLKRKTGDFDGLTIEYYKVRMEHYSGKIEEKWTHEFRSLLSAWTAKALAQHKRTSPSERSLSKLRLPETYPSLVFSSFDSRDFESSFIPSPPVDSAESYRIIDAFRFFDTALSVFYEESRKRIIENKPLDSYASLILSNARFAANFPKALPALHRLYDYEQPQALVLAKIFGLYGETPMSPEACVVLNHHRQVFKRLVFASKFQVSSHNEQYNLSVCWEASLEDILREYVLHMVHGSESLRIWTVWISHLKPERVSIGEFGWFLLAWILRHFVATSPDLIWKAADPTNTGVISREEFKTLLYNVLDKLIPEVVLEAMFSPGELVKEQEFKTSANQVVSKPENWVVRGDMFMCGVAEAFFMHNTINSELQTMNQFSGASDSRLPFDYSHPLLTPQVLLLSARPQSP